MENVATSREDQQRGMYGCTEQDLYDFVVRHIGAGKTFENCLEAALSILSDCQEEMAMEMQERARKGINRAKWLIEHHRGRI